MNLSIQSILRKATFFLLLLITQQGMAQIHYVRLEAAGSGDGTSWTNAYTVLQQAIDAAGPGDSIFVAEGVYLPTYRHLGDSARHSTFYVNKKVGLFGGFSGVSGTEGGFLERNITLYPTHLSGDIGLPDMANDNSFHVLYLDHVTDTTRIDGFTIERGNGTGGVGFESIGAGIYNNADGGLSSPTIANCIIRDNKSVESGGGMTNQAENGGTGSPTLLHCSFISNISSGGGGINNYTDTEGEANPVFINCRFLGNSGATAGGGAIQCIAHSSETSPVLINCVLTGNHSPTSGALAVFITGTAVSHSKIINTTISGNTGSSMRLVDIGLQTSTVLVRNSILFGNQAVQAPSVNGVTVDAAFSVIPFGFPGEGIVGLTPMFVSPPPVMDTSHVLGDVHLEVGSPAIDAGINSAVPSYVTTDLDLLPRFVNPTTGQAGTVDIGAYEYQGNTTSIGDLEDTSPLILYPNPTTGIVHITLPESRSGGVIRVMDQQGKVVQSIYAGKDVAEQYQLDLSAYHSGTYLISYLHGQVIQTQKVMLFKR